MVHVQAVAETVPGLLLAPTLNPDFVSHPLSNMRDFNIVRDYLGVSSIAIKPRVSANLPSKECAHAAMAYLR
jgi:hypothetical protein